MAGAIQLLVVTLTVSTFGDQANFDPSRGSELLPSSILVQEDMKS